MINDTELEEVDPLLTELPVLAKTGDRKFFHILQPVLLFIKNLLYQAGA